MQKLYNNNYWVLENKIIWKLAYIYFQLFANLENLVEFYGIWDEIALFKNSKCQNSCVLFSGSFWLFSWRTNHYVLFCWLLHSISIYAYPQKGGGQKGNGIRAESSNALIWTHRLNNLLFLSISPFFIRGIIIQLRDLEIENWSFPYNQVTVSVFVCLSLCVPKNLDNHWTNMVLLYRVASHRFWEGICLFPGKRTTTLPKENASLIIII